MIASTFGAVIGRTRKDTVSRDLVSFETPEALPQAEPVSNETAEEEDESDEDESDTEEGDEDKPEHTVLDVQAELIGAK